MLPSAARDQSRHSNGSGDASHIAAGGCTWMSCLQAAGEAARQERFRNDLKHDILAESTLSTSTHEFCRKATEDPICDCSDDLHV